MNLIFYSDCFPIFGISEARKDVLMAVVPGLADIVKYEIQVDPKAQGLYKVGGIKGRRKKGEGKNRD